MLRSTIAIIILTTATAADRPVDPTFLYRNVSQVEPVPSDVTTPTCRYKPLFGAGDSNSSIVKGVARYGEMTVDPEGKSTLVNYPREEQVYYVLEGRGEVHYQGFWRPIRQGDYMYFAPGAEHGARNNAQGPLRIMVMGYHIPMRAKVAIPGELPITNRDRAKKQVVGQHPPSTLYQRLLGSTGSKVHLLRAAHVLEGLFIMEFAPGGTNHPHHHYRHEEIYFVLDGHGDIVAGGGTDGVEGRRPAGPGDAYFYRANATVGFYADDTPGAPKAHILAARSLFPAAAPAKPIPVPHITPPKN
jgi:mannose-6-phosphate isomerase-like protein (cupin superfamily)